jgi:hypothetical protein
MKRTRSRRSKRTNRTNRTNRSNRSKRSKRSNRSKRSKRSKRSNRSKRSKRRSSKRRVKAGSSSIFSDESKESKESKSVKEDNLVVNANSETKLRFELIDYEYSDGKKGVNKVLSGKSLNSRDFTLSVIPGDLAKERDDKDKLTRLELKNSNTNVTIILYRPFIQKLKASEMYKIFDTVMEPPIHNYIEVKADYFPEDYSFPVNFDDNPRAFIN